MAKSPTKRRCQRCQTLRLLIFFPLQQTARLSRAAELLGQARAAVAVLPGILHNLGSAPRPESNSMFARHPGPGVLGPGAPACKGPKTGLVDHPWTALARSQMWL